MGKPQAPESPDYVGAAQAQGAANVDAARATARLSNPNMITPYGNQTVAYEGDIPTVTQTLTPTGQQTVEQQQQTELGLAQTANQQQAAIGQLLNTPFSFGGTPQTQLPQAGQIAQASTADPLAGGAGYGAVPNAPNLQTALDESQIAQMPINAGTTAQQAILSRLDPSLQQQRTRVETQLINQGLRPGGEAYDNAINLLGQQENDARQQAVLQGLGLDISANQQGFGQALTRGQFGNQALGQGLEQQLAAQGQGFGQTQSQEAARNAALQQNYQNQLAYQQAQNAAQQQQFGQGLQGAQFGNTAIQQQLAQALNLRDQPINEITALLSGSQVQNPQFPGYQGSTTQAAPLFQGTQAQGAWDQNIYNQQVAQRNALMGGLFGLGGAVTGGLFGLGR